MSPRISPPPSQVHSVRAAVPARLERIAGELQRLRRPSPELRLAPAREMGSYRERLAATGRLYGLDISELENVLAAASRVGSLEELGANGCPYASVDGEGHSLYAAPFGRDSLYTALFNVETFPRLSATTIRFVA